MACLLIPISALLPLMLLLLLDQWVVPAGGCTWAGLPFASVPDELRFKAQQILDGRQELSYDFAFRPCTPPTLCPGAPNSQGYLQQMYNQQQCLGYWDQVMGAELLPNGTGVVVTLGGIGPVPLSLSSSSSSSSSSNSSFVANLTFECDPSARNAVVDANGGQVQVSTTGFQQYFFAFRFRSACACAGGKGCSEQRCSLGRTGWSASTETRLAAMVTLGGQPQGQYLFALNPCWPATLCKAATGLLQMATGADGVCEVQWPTVTGVDELGGGGGIVVRLDGKGASWAATAAVTIQCDPEAGSALVDGNNGLVAATTEGFGNYSFRLAFSSGCACGKGCTSASCFIGPKPWYNVLQTQFSARAVVDGTPQPSSLWAFSPCGGSTLCANYTDPDFVGVFQTTWVPGEDGNNTHSSSSNSNSSACADWGPVVRTGVTDGGVQLNVTRQFGSLQATAVVDIQCDPQAGGVVRDANGGVVVVTTVRPGLELIVGLRFTSGCACGNGCPPL